MKRTFAVLMLLALATLLVWPQTVIVVKKKAGGPTYLINEGFDGTGAPSGWSSSGTVDWDEATIYHDGAQSAQIDSSSADSYAEISFTGADDIYGEYWWYSDYTPSADGNIIRVLNGFTQIGVISHRSTGVLSVGAAGGTGSSCTLAITEDSWVRIWWHYHTGTGADAVIELWWNTSDSHPGNGDAQYYCASTNGTSTLQANKLRNFSDNTGATNGSRFIDAYVVDDEILW